MRAIFGRSKNLEKAIKIIHVSPYIPRECGIATYTKHLADAVNTMNPECLSKIVAIDNSRGQIKYPNETVFRVNFEDQQSYQAAASFLNQSEAELVHLQHEFGLFGGNYGEYIQYFVKSLNKPLFITFHTVVPSPDSNLRLLVRTLAAKSRSIIVMVDAAAKGLVSDYGIDKNKITVIPHGVANVPFVIPDEHKESLGLKDRKVISTFGLLSKNKGLEYVIGALPEIRKIFPEVLYLIIGKTHPVVAQNEGEIYRDKLLTLIKSQDLFENVQFYNHYVNQSEITSFLNATDIYVTPYLEPEQISSGTLATALGHGKAVITTPYLYAKETVPIEEKCFVDFHNSRMISDITINLLSDDDYRYNLGFKNYLIGRKMIWENVAERHLKVFRKSLATVDFSKLF